MRFTARPGVRLEGVVVHLVDELRYVVEVTDAEGAPVPDATVRVFGAEHGERALAPLRGPGHAAGAHRARARSALEVRRRHAEASELVAVPRRRIRA